MTPQPLEKAGTIIKVIEDVEALVGRCDEPITIEFRHFLSANGCPSTTITQAGYRSAGVPVYRSRSGSVATRPRPSHAGVRQVVQER